MNGNHLNLLDEVIGKTYIYKNKQYHLTGVREAGNNLIVNTTTRNIIIDKTGVEEFIEQLKSVDDIKQFVPSEIPLKRNTSHQSPITIHQPSMKLPGYEKSEIHTQLETALSSMIAKVTEDKEAIPQANALCNIANSLVGMERQQINFLKATGQL